MSQTTVPIIGLPIQKECYESACTYLANKLTTRQQTLVAYANTNLINAAYTHASLAEALQDFWLLNDGIGLSIAAKLVHQETFPANMNGTDFTPHLLQQLPSQTPVFFYGSHPDVVTIAAQKMAQTCDIKIAGTQDGYTPISPKDLCTHINASKAEVLLVALGNPRQELWMMTHRKHLNVPIIIGVGALFDFTAQRFKRAPQWIQRIHMEWAFRLMQEPRRLFRRYILETPVFLYRVWKTRKNT